MTHWWNEIPLKKPTPVDTARLSFDYANPRYTSEKGLPHGTDEEIVIFLNETSDLPELLQSIASSGYVDIEPLVVLGEGEKLVTLEGNRRLAAIRVLTDSEFAARCGISAPAISADNKATLAKASVYRVDNRRDARDFIGFKHINGSHPWDSLAKARFAADWLRDEIKQGGPDASLQNIARRMGDRHATLARMVHGIFVLEQAERNNLFSIEDREPRRQFAFSHLYTGLTRPGIRQFLGLSDDSRSAEPRENPIDPKYFPQLKQLLRWMYGSDSDETPAIVRSQNPHLRELSEVLESPKARKIMLESNDLPRAYAEVDTPQRQFEHRLVEAHGALEGSLAKVSAYDGEDQTLLDIANEINANARSILLVMTAKQDGKAKPDGGKK